MAGLPDIDALATYGGAKSNYSAVEDPTTDLDADHLNLIAANVAGMTQTVARAWCAFVGNAATPTDPTSNVHGAVWGDDVSVKPTPARTGAGVYTLTWPATVDDELGVTHTVSLRRAGVMVEGSTPYFVTATVTAANVVTVRVFNAAGAANDAAGVTFFVWAT